MDDAAGTTCRNHRNVDSMRFNGRLALAYLAEMYRRCAQLIARGFAHGSLSAVCARASRPDESLNRFTANQRNTGADASGKAPPGGKREERGSAQFFDAVSAAVAK